MVYVRDFCNRPGRALLRKPVRRDAYPRDRAPRIEPAGPAYCAPFTFPFNCDIAVSTVVAGSVVVVIEVEAK